MAPSSPVEKFRVEYVDVSGRPQQVWMHSKELVAYTFLWSIVESVVHLADLPLLGSGSGYVP